MVSLRHALFAADEEQSTCARRKHEKRPRLWIRDARLWSQVDPADPGVSPPQFPPRSSKRNQCPSCIPSAQWPFPPNVESELSSAVGIQSNEVFTGPIRSLSGRPIPMPPTVVPRTSDLTTVPSSRPLPMPSANADQTATTKIQTSAMPTQQTTAFTVSIEPTPSKRLFSPGSTTLYVPRPCHRPQRSPSVNPLFRLGFLLVLQKPAYSAIPVAETKFLP
jgi:hypothetical protein